MRTLTGVIGLVALGALCLARPGVARAECPYFVMPPATGAVPSAREVIVGTVVENVGGLVEDFRLRIDHVFRGPAHVGEVRRFNHLYPGWPPALDDKGAVPVPAKRVMPCEPIRAWKGSVIALALGALAPDGTTRYNAESWISGDPPFSDDRPKTTLGEIERLAALPATDAVAMSDPSTPAPTDNRPGLVLLAIALGIGGTLAWRLTRSTRGRR